MPPSSTNCACSYCGKDPTTPDRIYCQFCGAPLPKLTPRKDDGYYFMLNGYVVWVICDPPRDTRSFYFYRGTQLVEHFEFSMPLLRERMGALDDVLWQLFLVAQGEQEVLTMMEQDVPYPAIFEIRRIENPDRLRWRANQFTLEEVRK
jgi:hypothetical protein